MVIGLFCIDLWLLNMYLGHVFCFVYSLVISIYVGHVISSDRGHNEDTLFVLDYDHVFNMYIGHVLGCLNGIFLCM